MIGRKLSTSALVGSLAVVTALGGCRDRATTGPSDIPSRNYAANLRSQSGDMQVGPVALPLPQTLTVKVVDAGGGIVQGASVTWVVIAGGGSVIPPTAVSDVFGFARTSWTLGTGLGENKVRAYLYGAYLLDSATFTATALHGFAATIVLSEATKPPAIVPVATTLPAMIYTVTDQFGHPVPGATVSFAASSGTVNPTSAVTDSLGKVSTVWTTGTVAGVQQSVSATLLGQLPVVSVIDNTTPDTSRRMIILSGSNQTTSVGGTLPLPLTVQILDRFNNPISGEVVTFNDSLGSGGSVTPTSATTDVTGAASTMWRVGAVAGPLTMRVRTPGSGGRVVRFSATATVAFRDVFTGNYFTCGIGTNDHAYCWGFGEDGQLGIGATPAQSPRSRGAPSWPVTQGPDSTGLYPSFREVSGGRSHACAVSIARDIYCWGFTGTELRMFGITQPSPVAVRPNISSVRMVVTGESYSCYITLAGLVECSGTNEVGETGGFLHPPLLNPRYSLIAAGQRHACAMKRLDPGDALLVPRPSQTPWCWGLNSDGQLGDGLLSFADAPVPQSIVMPVGVAAFDSTSLVAGAAHTCAIASFAPGVGGAAYCWGSNASGQLGDGTVPPFASGLRSAVPVPVTGGYLFVRLYAGEYHTCGLTATGTAYCWGRNSSGQLGNNGTSPTGTPTAVSGGLTFSNLAMGELHTCGITGPLPTITGTTGIRGTIYCWGDAEYGQLGLGLIGSNGTPSLTPQLVRYQQ